VRHGKRLETQVGAEREGVAVAHVEDADREARIQEPAAVPLGEGAQQLHDARWPENHEGLGPRRDRGVLERVHEHRQFTPVVGVEVRQHNVADLVPGEPEFGEPMQRARAAVEQHAHVAAGDPMAGAGAVGRGSDGAGADGDEVHDHFPRKTMRLKSTIPGALSL